MRLFQIAEDTLNGIESVELYMDPFFQHNGLWFWRENGKVLFEESDEP